MQYRALFLALSLLLASSVWCQTSSQNGQAFRVVGYYFLRAAVNDSSNNKNAYPFLDRLTHLNIAFINPDSAGNFQTDLGINNLVQAAHAKGVKVLASIAGGGSHAYYSKLLRMPQRTQLVADLTRIVLQNGLDGVDVDLEGGDIDEHYEPFVTELAASLKKHGKLITSAIATAYKDQLTDKALEQFDFTNIMSYDATGPWRPQDPGPHAPYDMAVRDLDYWLQARGLPSHKINLGLPFYGYVWGAPTSPVGSMTYGEIAAVSTPQQKGDSLHLPGPAVVYYNGPVTIQNKTNLALKRAGGVMIWQILGDAAGDKALLTLIQNTIKASGKVGAKAGGK